MNAKLDQTLLMMDIVDKMRHDENIVNKQINEILNSAEIKEKLKSFYAKSGIVVTDALLEKAYLAYKENQFAYKWAPDNFLTKVLKLYVIRDKWLLKAQLSLGAVSLMVLLGILGQWVFIEIPAKLRLEEAYTAVQQHQGKLPSEVSQLRNQVLAVSQRLESETTLAEKENRFKSSPVFVSKAQEQKAILSSSTLVLLDSLETKALSLEKDIAKLPKEIKALEEAQRKIQLFTKELQKVSQEIAQAQSLIQVYGEFKILETKASAIDKAVPKMEQAFATQVRKNLQNFDNSISQFNLEPSKAHYAAAQALYTNSISAQDYWMQFLEQEKRVESAQSDVRQQMASFKSQIQAKLNPQDIGQVPTLMTQIKNFADYALTEVRFEVVNEQGVKTGVERTYSENGQAAKPRYYLIARAKSPQGQSIPFRFEDNESKKVYSQDLFGVEVSFDQYEKTKADKKQDGIVDDDVLGVKKAGSLKVDKTLDIKENSYLAQW